MRKTFAACTAALSLAAVTTGALGPATPAHPELFNPRQTWPRSPVGPGDAK